MKYKTKRKVKCIFCLLICTLIFTRFTFAWEIVVMTGDWKPFVSSELAEYGFLTVVVSKAFQAVGVKTDIQFAPWTRCEAAIKHGKSLVTFPYSITEERSEFAYFSDSIAKSRTVFFYNRQKRKTFEYTGLDNLGSLLVGGIRGYFYIPQLKKAGLSIDYSENENDAFKKLLYGRVDLVLLNELVGWKIINTFDSDQVNVFASSKSAFSINELRLMVSKKHPGADEHLKLFNKGLQIIKTNGVYRKIFTKFKIPEPVGNFE